MAISLLLSIISSLSSNTTQFTANNNLFRTLQGLLIFELSSICINLTLVLVFLLIVSARQIFICAGRARSYKEGSNGNSVPSRRTVDTEIRSVEIGKGYKASAFRCFYVLFLEVLLLGFDGFGLIRKGTDWTHLLFPAAQGLAWFVLSFSALHCKFKLSAKFLLLLRVWWAVSFIFCLCTLYGDGKEFLTEGSKHWNSHVLANFAATPALAFLCFVAIRGVTGKQVYRNSDLQETLLVEEEAERLKVTPYSEAGLFSLVTLSWLNPILSTGAKRLLELRDIPLLAPKDRYKTSYKILNSNWEKLKVENPSKQPSLAMGYS